MPRPDCSSTPERMIGIVAGLIALSGCAQKPGAEVPATPVPPASAAPVASVHADAAAPAPSLLAQLKADPAAWQGKTVELNGTISPGQPRCTKAKCGAHNPNCNSCVSMLYLHEPGQSPDQGIELGESCKNEACARQRGLHWLKLKVELELDLPKLTVLERRLLELPEPAAEELLPTIGPSTPPQKRPLSKDAAQQLSRCEQDADCELRRPQFCGCKPCGKVAPVATRKGVPANCQVRGAEMICSVCDPALQGQICPACAPLYQPELYRAVCREGRCELERRP